MPLGNVHPGLISLAVPGQKCFVLEHLDLLKAVFIYLSIYLFIYLSIESNNLFLHATFLPLSCQRNALLF